MLQAVPKSKCQWNELKCQVVVISHCVAAKHLLVVRCLAPHQERLKMALSLHQVRFAFLLVLLIGLGGNMCLIPRCGKNDSFDCATIKNMCSLPPLLGAVINRTILLIVQKKTKSYSQVGRMTGVVSTRGRPISSSVSPVLRSQNHCEFLLKHVHNFGAEILKFQSYSNF